MSEGEVLHPFVIDKALPDKFGYAKAFLQKQLVWDFAATSGGGRHTAASVRDLMAEMGDLTREGSSMEERQTLLETLFHHHYDTTRIEFIYQFLFGEGTTPLAKLNKGQTITFMAQHHAPFIPYDIMAEHLRKGLVKYKNGKAHPCQLVKLLCFLPERCSF